MQIIRYKCVICGKITTGRRTGRYSDLSERFPRLHNGPDGDPCEGNYEFSEWIEVEGSFNAITGRTKMGKVKMGSG